MSLEQRVAVITGATGGLGRAVSKSLAERGARLALFSRGMEKLRLLADEIGLSGERCLTGAYDFSEQAAAQEAAAKVMEKFGRADMLLHFVGGWTGGKTVAEFEASAFEDMARQHLWSTLHAVRAFVPHLVANGWGRIVVVTSPTAALPPAKMAPYAVAKAAQEALILALAQELKDTGVTANALRVRTIDVNHERQRQPTSANASWSTPEEIAAAVLYLCSDEAGVVNGARIPLYGGP
jgi:NAD(P)-dependent dehydrogenase (short-subunit alcohol dehydrogenase family)